ncbi:phosphate-selective porin OprO and OprP [Lysobacter sp. yr284]|uniref:OprO/OprP family phosphate-selective porin n=1 Tax=Lysobacter TaxID=68 RepID=UPI00089CC021|nr:OprO/OprP family phosphate-selective porin [Lysobacter sp. yr284]SDY29163.1 phosphate-selective porin OprO and OprP [Lysobacter sp. yr284]
MKLSRTTLAVALLAALAAPAAHAEIALDVIGDSEVTFEGLVQADYNDFNSDVLNLNGDLPDGKDTDQELRRAELVLKGKGPGNFEWVAGYDAKADKFLDVNLKYKIGGDGNHFVQFGQFKQPNSMEELSSTKNNDFISKAMVTNTFGIARRLGAAYSYGTNDWSLTASYFGDELTRNQKHGKGYGLRGTFAPINEKGNVLHLGLSYVNLDAVLEGNTGILDNSARIRTRPQADLAAGRLVDSGTLTNVDTQAIIGAEAMYVQGPFKVQAEYMRSTLDRYKTATLTGKDYTTDSWYVSGMWNITGETWGYKSGTPTTPLPNEPATGMWQVGLRYDKIDLNDGSLRPGATPTAAPIVDGVLGGEMSAWTVGVNWYWRSNFKFMLDYSIVDSSRYIGKTSATYSQSPQYNNRTFNRVVDDSPNVLSARLQFYW